MPAASAALGTVAALPPARPARPVAAADGTAPTTVASSGDVMVADMDVEPPDNDDQPPPAPSPHMSHTWPTSSLTLTEAMADLRKGLAGLLQPATAATTSTTTQSLSTSPEQVRETTAMWMSSSTIDAADVVDDLSRGPLASPADDAAMSLFKVPPRFAMPPTPSAVTTGPRTRGAATASNAANVNSLTARRMVQLTGPGSPIGFQTAPAGSVSWSLDGVVRSHGSHGVGTPVGPGGVGTPWGPWGAPNMTGVMGQRGSVTGTLAGSLHGGVNVLLGGAMLSGLILLVFFICYCCQRSARKSDAHFRTQYWLPDPDGPLEVFTLDAQSQRLERAGAILVPTSDPMDLVITSPSPPPAYHTVVNLPPLAPLSKPLDGSSPSSLLLPFAASTVDGGLASPDHLDAAAKGLCPVTSATSGAFLPDGLVGVDVDGLPSYETALKLESQGHM